MSSEKRPLSLNTDNFESTLQSDGPVLVDFWADWCAPCRALGPTVDALAADYDGTATIAKLDVVESPELAEKYSVVSIPTIVFFQNGQEVDRVTGVVPRSALTERLDALTVGV